MMSVYLAILNQLKDVVMSTKVTRHDNGDGTGTKTTVIKHSNGSTTTKEILLGHP